jgi:hypothetical protein
MSIRDDLVAQVEQAIKDVPLLMAGNVPLPDIPTMANAAVDAVAIFVFVQLASGEGQFLAQIEKALKAKQ